MRGIQLLSFLRSILVYVALSPLSSCLCFALEPKMIGLVEIPKLEHKFEEKEPWDDSWFKPTPVKAFELPDKNSAWSMVDSGLKISTKEFREGWRLAEVFEVKNGFYKVQVKEEAKSKYLWIAKQDSGQFYPYLEIIKKRASVLWGAVWDGKLYPRPNGRPDSLPIGAPQEIKLLETETVKGVLWAKIELWGEFCGDSPRPPKPEGVGWIQVYNAQNQHLIWFLSRGC